MLKTAFSLIVASMIIFPNVSLAETNETTNEKKDAQQIKTNEVPSKIVSVDVSPERDEDTYTIKCLGSIKNNTNSTLKNVKVKVQFVDNNKNVIDQVFADTIEKLEAGEEKGFKVEKFLTTKVNQFNIRATSKVDGFENINIIQIAELILQGKKDELKYWDVRFNDPDFQAESNLRNYAIRTLAEIKNDDKDYEKAQDLINELKYVEGLRALETNDYLNGFLHLTNVVPTRKFGDKAEKAIILYRPKVIYEKAKNLIAQKKYVEALPLLRAIAPKTDYYNFARKELTNIHFYMNHNTKISSKNLDLQGYTDDQAKVIKLMETYPEYTYQDFPAKNITTWVFPDYSRFQFDFEGKLVKWTLYPLF
ncbi:MAG: FxLYD domain-containing protein [Candidatus Sericytochromatia bacterium]